MVAPAWDASGRAGRSFSNQATDVGAGGGDQPPATGVGQCEAKPLSPSLLERRFDGWSVNQAWVADITYVATDQGWLYLAAVMDLASGRIVGWSMSERIQAELACEALNSAYWRRKPGPGLIMHTDRGSQLALPRPGA